MVDVPKFAVFCEAVLVKMYHAAIEQTDQVYEISEIKEFFNREIGAGYVAQALKSILGKRFVEVDGGLYSISERGIIEVQEQLENPETFISKYENSDDEWLFSANLVGESDRGNESYQPNSDEEWEPLPIDRSAPEYESAVADSENALEIIENDNGYAANKPEERDQVVWSLREGLKTLKEGMPSRDQIISMIVQPLKFIANKFSAAAMGEAAKAAIKSLSTWLGLG